jgi:hypothetical protein
MAYLQPLLAGCANTEIHQNQLLDRLQAQLQRRRDRISLLQFRFEVLHLCSDEEEVISRSLSSTREAFDRNADRFLPEFPRTFRPLFPPRELTDIWPVQNPSKPRNIRFQGEQIRVGEEVTYYAGLGHLSDLVEIYENTGDDLFSKNVRLYLYHQRRGSPAKHIETSLDAICITNPKKVPPLAPERFALFHNGITLHATGAERVETGLAIRTPSILNGCQTVKTSYLFFKDIHKRKFIDVEKWDAIPIPLRTVITNDEDLVRNVTISNNRQTEISPSAYRASEPEQLKLANRFADVGIFYQRQQAAFDNLRMGNARELEEKYYNSPDRPIKIEELAQAIACAIKIPLRNASRVSELFEDHDYKAIFAEKHLRDLQILGFLTNLLFIMRLVLKDLKTQSTAKLEGLSAGRFTYPCTRLMSRYIAESRPKLIHEYGTQVLKSRTKAVAFRDEIRKLCAGANTGLQQMLPKFWRRSDGSWAAPTDTYLMNDALRELGLEGVDVFKTRF